MQQNDLYDRDFNLWIEETILALKSKDYHRVDWANLIEEIESMGKSDRRKLESYLTRLIEHWLKLKYWEAEKDRCYRGWAKEIINFRRNIKRILKDSPSLKNYLVDFYPEAFRDAVYAESKEFDLPEHAEVSLQEALEKEI